MKTPQQKIKALLVQMAIDATLPSDMNELDEHIFDPFVLSRQRIERYAENQALGHYFSEYPEAKSYDAIIELLDDSDEKAICEEIVVWEPFEYCSFSRLATLIEEFKQNIVDSLSELLKGE